jgi:Zn-finger nucleic acid-binding protein
MNAQTLHCQSCGAAISSDFPTCEHCGALLATISCPACFGMTFRGTKFCPHCGAAAAQWQSSDGEVPCPACEVPMLRGTLGQTVLHECEKCFGIWLDATTFERICRDAEQQATVLPGAGLGKASTAKLAPVRYRRCPECRELMHRVNFAQCSGVVVDVCREHGTWFDMAELQRIVEFIRAGGVDRARERKKAELAAAARRLETARQERGTELCGSHDGPQVDLLTLTVGSASGLLGRWLRR